MASNLRPIACLAALVAIGGCAANSVTLRSNHFRLAVPPGWQVVESGSGETPTLVRAPASESSPEIDVRLYPWIVNNPPSDAAGDVLARLTASNALGLAAAHADHADPCPDRATGFFVFGRRARAIHLMSPDGRPIVVTAGESNGSLVAVVGSLPPGASGCAAAAKMDAVIERLAASLTDASDLSHPVRAPTVADPLSGVPLPPPNVDPTAPP